MAFTNKLINSRLMSVLWLGVASGLPLALTGSTLQAWFTEAHINLLTIGFLSLLGIPYTLKFLWAPLMDYYHLPHWGRRKGFILMAQLGLIISLLILANETPGVETHIMLFSAFIIAFLSASQDVAINAYQTDILTSEERGLGAAYSIFAYRMAMLLSGGTALVIADYLGWHGTYYLMTFFMGFIFVGSYFIPKPQETFDQSISLWDTLCAALNNLREREKVLWLCLFIMFYKLGDAFALSLMSNFLLHGLGFNLTQVGFAFKMGGLIATILGTFVGGLFLMKINHYYALLWFGIAQCFSNLMFVLLAMAGKVMVLMASAIFIENFCSGLSTAALLAFMMTLCDHRYTASQFALLSAIASIARVFLGPVASLVVLHVGWVQFYTWSCLLCIPGLVFLVILKDKVLAPSPLLADI